MSEQPLDLRAIRDALGLTQVEMAERLGITQPTISLYEAGENPIPGPVRILLAQEASRVSHRTRKSSGRK